MSLLSSIAELLKPAPPIDPVTSKALNRVAELVDPMLRLAPGFEKHLAQPIKHALGYCDGLVAALPGPIDINRQAFSTNPLVHALFATAGDIDQMLGRSQAVRDFLAEPEGQDNEYFYALFAARRQQKKQLGMAQQGELIRNDVPQLVLYFSDQTLIEPSPQLDTAHLKLRCKALESLLQTFHAHVDSLRLERQGLRTDISIQRAHLTIVHGTTPGHDYAMQTRHLAELDACLRQSSESLMPEQIIQALAEFLRAPEPALHLVPASITVDRSGIVCDPSDDDINVQTLNFAELTTRDKRLYLAMLARISRDEALEAVEKVRDQQHRFMLI